MVRDAAPVPVEKSDREKILAYMVDELTFALGLVEDVGLGELAGPLQVIFDLAERELAASHGLRRPS